MSTQTGKKVKRLRTDNGLEFCNQEFDSLCKREGISRHKTVAYTPQQNGLAERMNMTLIERDRYMLLQSKLSKRFWAETVTAITYVINRSPSTAVALKRPEEVLSSTTPDLSKLRVF